METTMTTATAMTAERTVPARPWRDADTAHAGAFRSVQGCTVPAAGSGLDLRIADVDVRTAGDDAFAPITGVVYPRLEAPPV